VAKKPDPEPDGIQLLLTELRTTNDLLRLMLMPALRQRLDDVLGKPPERRAYEYSDGTRGTREVAELAGASPGSVSGWWNKWRVAGIALDAPGGRVRHVMPLSPLGMEVPEGGKSQR
jgi:hypothetical protein